MSEQNDGGPAFPAPTYRKDVDRDYDDRGYIEGESISFVPEGQSGLTIRDYFAAKAMQVLVHDNFSTSGCDVQNWRNRLAEESYAIAETMLAERAKK
jgi:hypothetical protein